MRAIKRVAIRIHTAHPLVALKWVAHPGSKAGSRATSQRFAVSLELEVKGLDFRNDYLEFGGFNLGKPSSSFPNGQHQEANAGGEDDVGNDNGNDLAGKVTWIPIRIEG